MNSANRDHRRADRVDPAGAHAMDGVDDLRQNVDRIDAGMRVSTMATLATNGRAEAIDGRHGIAAANFDLARWYGAAHMKRNDVINAVEHAFFNHPQAPAFVFVVLRFLARLEQQPDLACGPVGQLVE